MAPRALPPAAPAALRVVKAVAGKSLVIAIPRHSGKKATLPSNTAEIFSNSRFLPAYDREFWRKFSYTPIALKISTVLRRLGLRQLNSGPGKIVFYHSNVIKLSEAISDLAKSLPTTLEELLNVAVEDMPLRQEVANILNRHGDSIWGSGEERPWLLKACEGDVEYQKDLDFDSKTDDDVIRHHLRLWILIKAFNHTRNKIKPSARTVKANTDAYKASEKPRALTDSRKFQEPIIDENERDYGVLVDDRTGNMGNLSSVHKSELDTFQGNQAPRVESNIRKTRHAESASKTNIQGKRDTTVQVRKEEKVPGPSATQASTMSTRVSLHAAKSQEVGSRSKGQTPGTAAADNPYTPDRNRIEATAADHHRSALHSRLRRQSGKHAYTESTGSDLHKSRPSHSRTAKVLPEERSSWACSLCTQRHQACDRALPTCGNCPKYNVHCVYVEKRIPSGKQPRRDSATEVRGTLVAQETGNPTLLIAKDLPLNKYWDEKDWQVCYSHIHEQETFLATVRSLGMRVTPRYATSSSPTIEHFEELGKDIKEISQKLSGVFSAAQLFRYAEDRKFLDGEITLLLETHSTIWSFDSNRKRLLAPGEDVNYPRDLFFEIDEDQKILRMHLHRWIFLITLKNCQQKQGLTTNAVQPSSLLLDDVDGSRANSSENESDNMPVFDQNESAALPLDSDTFDITNSEPDISEPRVQKGLLDHADPREPGTDPLEAPEVDSATKRKQQPPSSKSESLFAVNSAIPPQRPSRQQRKRKTIDSENLEAQNASRPSKQPRNDHEHVPYPGHDLSALFISYLENHSDPEFNEAVALDNLAQELLVLKQHVPVFHSKRKTKLTKAFLTVSFPAWLSYREDIVAIKRMYVVTQTTEETSHRHRVVLERSRLATQLRQAHETFMETGSAGKRHEEVVFQVIMLLIDEDGESEAAAAMRDGFESLEEELITLCDDLMKSGGAKWILGDFPPVSSLEGMKSF